MTEPALKVGRYRLFERRGRRYRCRLCRARIVRAEDARAHRDREVEKLGEVLAVAKLRALALGRRAIARRDYARWLHESRREEGT